MAVARLNSHFSLFDEKFLPHAFCYLNNAPLVWTHVISDVLIAAAYSAISITLVWFVTKARADLPFGWMFLAFGLFIIACGATHAMEVVTTWLPVYVLSAAFKVFTAVVSVIVAVLLPLQVPTMLSIARSAKTSEARRAALEVALAEKDTAEGVLKSYQQHLATLVQQRTEKQPQEP